jgi:myxalamid-type polyketide synthase MxaB
VEDEIQALFEEVSSRDREDHVAFRHNVRYVARLVRSTTSAHQARKRTDVSGEQPVQLEIAERGVLDNLKLQPITRRQPGPGEVEIRCCATGLNFRDVLNALGMYPGDPGPLGLECAGKVVAFGEGVEGLQVGDNVVAFAPAAYRTFVTVPACFVVRAPEHLSFEEAATIPIAFLTAHYGLHVLAKMSAGDRILIHAAAGGVGMAAVQLAQRTGAEIFGTAGSPEKRAFLQSLGVQHVMDSRSLDFADTVMECTGGQGVDIVLNSLAGEYIPKSLSVLGANGRFVEIGKRDIWDERQVAQLRSDVSYFVFDLGEVRLQDPALIRSMLCELMQAFEARALKPLPRQVFPIEEAASAFRYMAQAKHIGKIVVTQRGAIPEPAAEASEFFATERTYLITGGLGGLGLRVARWMVERGARHLVLMGRSGASGAAGELINELQQAGAQIVVFQGDVSQANDVGSVLAHIEQSLPPLRGIVHAAGVLDDGILLQQTWTRFAKVMAPKVAGAWNLHTLTQNLPLDFFVLFSSVASLLGSPGQGNYAAANAFLDALAYHRRVQALPALSINWGPWTEAGMAAALGRQGERRWAAQGLGFITPERGLQALEQVLRRGDTQMGVLRVNWSKFAQQFAVSGEPPLLSELIGEIRAWSSSQQPSVREIELLRQLEASAPNKRYQLLFHYVQDQVVKVLGLEPSYPMDSRQALHDMGMDSLMAVELTNRLQTGLGLSFPSTLAFDYPTVEAIARHLAEKMLPAESSAQPQAGSLTDEQTQVLAEIVQLPEDAAEALLLAELAAMRHRHGQRDG